MKIAISAATGHFGQLAIQELLKTVAAGDIVAVVRNREKGQRLLPAGITVRQADYTDEVAMTTALAGIDRLLFISSVPGGPVSRQQQHANVVKAAQAAGVSYVAYTSFAKADTAQSPLSKDHVATEALLKASGLQVSFCVMLGIWKMSSAIYRLVLKVKTVFMRLVMVELVLRWNVSMPKRLLKS